MLNGNFTDSPQRAAPAPDAAKFHYSDLQIFAQHQTGGGSYSFLDRPRPLWGIGFFHFGFAVYTPAGGKAPVRADPGDIVLLHAGARYRVDFPAAAHDTVVNFRCSGSLTDDFAIVRHGCAHLAHDFLRLEEMRAAPDGDLLRLSLLFRILDAIMRDSAGTALSRRIRQALLDDTAFEKTEAALAAECFVSVSTMQRAFKAAYGMTVAAYRGELRLECAKRLLAEGTLSAEQIAERLHFCDASYFAKSFKRAAGVSPKEYRRAAEAL